MLGETSGHGLQGADFSRPDDHWIADSNPPRLHMCLCFSTQGLTSFELHNNLTHILIEVGVTQLQD